MKVDPGFLTHWKTERLLEELGAEGIVVLLRLWGRAQINREWKRFHLTPRRLALETKWKGDENHLFTILTDPDAPWLDLADDGTYSIHGFEEHQKQVIHLWSAGGKGGRPKKIKSELPRSLEEDSSTYSSSSSYPICKANENQMVSNGDDSLKTVQEIMGWINSLKPEWSKPARWNNNEEHLLHGGVCSQILEMSKDDRALIKKFLNTDLPNAKAYWQPYTRTKFVETFSDVYSSANRWAEKTGNKPQNNNQNKGVVR